MASFIIVNSNRGVLFGSRQKRRNKASLVNRRAQALLSAAGLHRGYKLAIFPTLNFGNSRGARPVWAFNLYPGPGWRRAELINASSVNAGSFLTAQKLHAFRRYYRKARQRRDCRTPEWHRIYIFNFVWLQSVRTLKSRNQNHIFHDRQSAEAPSSSTPQYRPYAASHTVISPDTRGTRCAYPACGPFRKALRLTRRGVVIINHQFVWRYWRAILRRW